MKKIRYICIVISLLFGLSAQALVFKLQGDKISIRAEEAPLRDVLMQFSRAGIIVRIDPGLESTVTGFAEKAPLEETLQELLSPHGYALLWDVVSSPLGDIPKLTEIQVFRRGHREEMVPLFDPDANLEVTTGPNVNGPLFVKDEVLLAVKPGTSLDEFKRLLAAVGGTVIECIPELGIYRVKFPPGSNVQALVEQLSQNPIVHTAEPNYAVKAPEPVMLAHPGHPVLPETFKLTPPPEGTAPVAVMDSGLGAIEGLNDVVIGKYDALNPERELSDALGHGTQMALVAAGAISPGGDEPSSSVPVVAIRAFDDNGMASNFGLMRGIEYAYSKGAKVLNLSWGSTVSSEFLANAIAYAQSKDMIVVASAGNEPTQQPMYPAAYPGVVAVGATNPDNSLWEHSNYGDFVTLTAPGAASFPVGYKGPPGAYAGTSIAGAETANALARYRAAHPTATATETKQALNAALTDTGAEGRDNLFGNGTLDADAKNRLLNKTP
ncbi:MAG: hypothetical protein EOM20_15420 [Spartobacteria bacterium]|nr:hypothetical protein [Spartobacteria bacterium]